MVNTKIFVDSQCAKPQSPKSDRRQWRQSPSNRSQEQSDQGKQATEEETSTTAGADPKLPEIVVSSGAPATVVVKVADTESEGQSEAPDTDVSAKGSPAGQSLAIDNGPETPSATFPEEETAILPESGNNRLENADADSATSVQNGAQDAPAPPALKQEATEPEVQGHEAVPDAAVSIHSDAVQPVKYQMKADTVLKIEITQAGNEMLGTIQVVALNMPDPSTTQTPLGLPVNQSPKPKQSIRDRLRQFQGTIPFINIQKPSRNPSENNVRGTQGPSPVAASDAQTATDTEPMMVDDTASNDPQTGEIEASRSAETASPLLATEEPSGTDMAPDAAQEPPKPTKTALFLRKSRNALNRQTLLKVQLGGQLAVLVKEGLRRRANGEDLTVPDITIDG